MSIVVAPPPVGLSALDTFARDATSYLYTYRYNARIAAGTKNLTVRAYVPTGSTARTPRPAVVLLRLGGFAITGSADNADAQAWADLFVKSGAIFFCAESRVYDDDPISSDDYALGITDDQYARTVNAAVEDFRRLYQWVRGVRTLDTWAVEPNWVFPCANSSGGMTALCLLQKHRWLAETMPGLLLSATGYGWEGSPSFDTAIRTTLGYTEAGHDGSLPPVCAFLGGSDAVIGNRIAPFKSTIEGLGGDNIVHYNPAGGHDAAYAFSAGSLTGASTVAGAMKNFIDTRTAAVPRATSGPVFG